ncbi:MAG: hypothetical protein PF636_04440 [Actinomycetota bacterium]|nr:hypothetical protein [Actinomycetota bacterium]
MDWNWFFSAVAQSVAALVGVLGAFLVARLLGSEESYARNRRRTRELLRTSSHLADQAQSRYFRWYNERTLEDGLRDVRHSIRDGESDAVLSREEYYASYGFSQFMPKGTVLEQIDDAIAKGLELRGRRHEDYLLSAFQADIPTLSVEQEGEAISQLVVTVRAHMREVREHLQDVQDNPERSGLVRVVLVTLLLLFWTGVVYPLSLLPVDSQGGSGAAGTLASLQAFDSHRLLVLSVATVLFTALIVVLGVRNERLKHPAEEVADLRRSLDPKRYSDYLQAYADNGRPLD